MTQNFWFDLFDLVTSDDLDLKLLRMVPQSVLDTIHANWLASFASNIVNFRANAIKPETSIFRLWPDLWRHRWPRGQQN